MLTLTVEDLKKSYGHFQLNVSFQVEEGRVTGFLGRNGSGKSTSFKAILNLIRPDSGKISLFGRDAGQLTEEDKEKLGVVFSDSGFSRMLRPIDLPPILRVAYPGFDEPMFRSYIDKHQLPWKKKFEDFSTGMSVKIKIITAISHRARFLILDEPTAGLDVVARNELIDLLRDYMDQDERNSILISSHISSDLEGLCDDFYLIDQGKIIMHEYMDVLLGQYGILKIRTEDFDEVDQEQIPYKVKEAYGYRCLTKQRQFYLDNYPKMVVEKANIDELISLATGGRK